MRKPQLMTMALSIMGMSAALFGFGPAGKASAEPKHRQWHDPERVAAAAARRVLREQRNLAQQAAGGYGG